MINIHTRVIIELIVLIGIVGMILIALLLFGNQIGNPSFITGR